MLIYCDRLTLRATLALAAYRLSGRVRSGTLVHVMDGAIRGRQAVCAAALSAIGVKAAEVSFFAGHLQAASGESVGAVAAKEGTRLADLGGERLLAHSARLRVLNETWGRDTVRLRVAKQLWLPAMALMLRVLTAEALSRASGSRALLLVRWPQALPRDLLAELGTAVTVRPTGVARAGWKAGRVSPFLWAGRGWLGALRRPRTLPPPADALPVLLVLQEDDLSADRSVRSQPHWWHGDPPPFRTLVLQTSRTCDVHLSAEERARGRIDVIDLAQLAALRTKSALAKRLRRDLSRLGIGALVSRRGAVAVALAEGARLVLAAAELAHLVEVRSIRAFLTCENYMMHADAMQLLAGPLGVATLSYQYTNLPTSSLLLATTSDLVLTFSPLFHGRFSRPGFPRHPSRDTGYVFSSSFPLVTERGRQRRARLEAAGARFVIGVFDESVQRDKYGWLGLDDYERELFFFLDRLRRDPSIGLVFKTQFQHNRRGGSPRLEAALADAIATGRLEVPSTGRHRNAVFPAEVAASCDIVVGHALGGTASLECALAGCRSIMVNSYNFVSELDHLYARAKIKFATLDDAWDAIEGLRRGDAVNRDLGRWDPILAQFDPYNDGASAARFRQALEEAVQR